VEVVGDLFLERGYDRRDIRVGQHGALVNDRDLNRGSLGMRGLWHIDLIVGYNLGVNAFAQKPVDFEQFGEAIRHIGMFWMLVNQAPPPGVYADAKAQGT
jgi:hypothetical protein